ncbi:MAG: High-affnity carbon uptake protein Hat/HatR [Cyclobacteriaceae bacterium]|nr:High-affnity carbon uptake protein Hat/HatR [Cyclobacteriaceae bacterium]MCX7637019.1 High-affnity carbon uptake protein Hat/HatR [Cyclobacteriaceae bacterium]MDW8330141.1 High-affnity carbon uptake protein Hat/HatR [Cyclobacteriaceae bacterium]
MYHPAETIAAALNPFPGLRPFKIEESHLFFGREGQSDEVLLKLSRHRFVAVIGPSGSGKSSFIYCGVLPILFGGFLTDTSPDWEVVVTRPGSGPIENLADSLLKSQTDYLKADADEQKIKRTIFTTLLRSSSLGLVEAIQQSRRTSDVNYLILVDQFEELFRFKDSTDPNSVNETLAFVNLLIEAVNYPDAPIYVAITMRSDFIGECAQFPELTRKINDSHYLIPQLTREQKRKAIEGPVAVGGATITQRLVQQLLNDLGDNPDQLPILQHALMRTWNYWAAYREREDEPLDLKHYEAIGTMREALSMHANEAYDELTEEQQRICEVMFKAITEKRGENFGIRRPTRLNEIAAIANCPEEEVIEVIEKFREPGRSLLTPAFGTPLHSKSMIDISHESLMRIWTRLKNWVDDEADAVQMYLRLAEAASMYQVGKAGLWRPPDLQLALNWQAKHKPTLVWGQRYHPAFERTMVFLEYSRKEYETEQRIRELEQKRKLQRIRRTAIVFAILTIVALLFLVYAFIQQTIAEENYKLAEQRRLEAEDLRQQAEAARDSARVERDNAIAARQAEAEQRKRAEEAQLRAEQNAEEARRQKEEADRQRIRAQENEKQAIANEARALEQEKLAKQNAAEALRQRYLAQARAMALKSLELGSEPELEGLLAQQAYNFNTTHGGEPYDNDIYNGLFYALRNFNHPLTESLKGHEYGAARALVTHASDATIYSGGSDGKIIRWTADNGLWKGNELVGRRSEYQVYAMDLSPDETRLVAAGLNFANDANNYIELYELNNMKNPKKIYGFAKAVENVQFTPDGKGIYARDNGGRTIRYSDFTNTRPVINPPAKINAIELSADGTKLAGAGDNGTLYVWDVTRNFAATELKLGNASLTALTWHPVTNQLVVGNATGQLRIVRDGMVIRTLSGHKGPIEQIKYNHKATFFASASKDKTVRLWNVNKLTVPPIELRDHLDWVWSLTFSPDDEQIMVGLHSSQQTIHQNQLRNEESIRSYPTVVAKMANILCNESYVKRNMNSEEWSLYSGGLNYEKTCPNYPANNN